MGIQGLNNQIKQTKQAGIKDILPQLDGMYNAKDSSNFDSHEYLDLANTQDRPQEQVTGKIILIPLK